MSIDIVCPLYQAEQYIEDLHMSFLKQQYVHIHKIKYILTESTDNTEEILKRCKLHYEKIFKDQFSHSLVREKAILDSKADIVVLVTQDVVIEANDWLYELTKDINDDIIYTYSRQLTKYDTIEKYTRESNYPENSIIKCSHTIGTLGLKTFFCSDASCAIHRKKFMELGGYDHKDLPANEDMYYAYKVIMNGYQVKYCADSIIYHSHNFTLKELYERYKLIGMFFADNRYLDQYGTFGEGLNLVKYVLKRIFEEKRFCLLIRYPFDMMTRLIGMKVGETKRKF